MEGLEKLKSGEFNNLRREAQSDGSVIMTLYCRKERKVYHFRVRDLYGPNEEVLEEEVREP